MSQQAQRPMQQDDLGGRGGLFIGLLIGISLLLIAGLLIFLIFIATRPSSSAAVQSPYDISVRPLPTNNDIRQMMPSQVGSFTRATVSGNLNNALTGTVNATYTGANSSNLVVKASRDTHTDQAIAEVTIQSGLLGASDRVTGQATDYSFAMITEKGGAVHYIYAHAFWVFNITANNRATLDAFMKAFPY